MKDFKKNFITSLASSYIIQFSIMGISFISQMVIARVLGKFDFGIFFEAAFVNLILTTLIDLGFNKHLIRSDYDKWGNAILIKITLAIAIIILFQLKPNIISFYDKELIPVMKIFSINILFLTISGVFGNYFLKELKIQRMIIPQIFSTIIYVVLVIYFGFHFKNYWAMIYATMIAEILKASYLTILFGKELLAKIKFTLKYSYELIKGAFYLNLIALVGVFYNQIHVALIGKLLTASFVGAFGMAYKFVLMPEKIISKAFRQVLYPAYTANTENRERVQKIIKYATLSVVAVEVFIYVLMFIYADFIIKIAYGSKWLDIVPLFRFICFIPIIFPYGKYLENLIVAYKYERWNLIGILYNLTLTIILGIILIPKAENYGMGLIRYFSAFIAFIPIYITIKKLKFKIFFKEYLLVYSPLILVIITPLNLKLRLILFPVIALIMGTIFYLEYQKIFKTYFSIKKAWGKVWKK